jgi:hypothetical protein
LNAAWNCRRGAVCQLFSIGGGDTSRFGYLLTPRSSTNRPRVPTLIALGWLAVWPLMAGCQSGAQQDLIARELRMHEDQIYAMEDYLTQYQQLVCKYRSENAALRKQLADDYYDEGRLPAPRDVPGATGGQTTPPGGTSIEIRETPGREGQQPPSREIEIDLPEVPPLEGSTSDESGSQEIIRAVHLEPETTDYGEAASAAGQPPHNRSAKSPGMARVQQIIDQSKTPLRLHGEVVASDPVGGPRLIVNVECTDDLASAGTFEGEASLMLLAPNKPRSQQSLARWDFSAADVETSREDADDERTMRFYLELPADTPIDESTELWVRLVPRQGDKLLAHTNVDFGMPGRFGLSAGAAGWLGQRPSMSQKSWGDAPDTPAHATASILESDWSIARPGEPANLPSAEEILTGGWRTSSEPISVAAQTNALAKPERPVVRQAVYTADRSESKPAPTYKAPTWSPDRSPEFAIESDSEDSRDTAISNHPAWSATR